MRVVVVGGYGVFGGNLVEMLARDGHDVWVAGRESAKVALAAVMFASQTGKNIESLQVDLSADLTPIFAVQPDAVVDAAGPYHAYGGDTYRLPKACIARAVHYLDLSDSGPFTEGISAFDDAAKAAQVTVLSGASSVPGLSSSVVAALGSDLDAINVIESAILPGNDAPRGVSVISSIVSQVGKPLAVMRGGRWIKVHGWEERELFVLKTPWGKDLRRAGYAIGAPDHILFPTFFGARSVRFHAGLELPIMNGSLFALSWLRRVIPLPSPSWALRALKMLADAMRPLGSDIGGMLVRVRGTRAGKAVTKEWHLIA
ncbi:MAG: saccharopine dehydrogenase NADP-binding domain-containing protein [Pseudomonadota bacterium]